MFADIRTEWRVTDIENKLRGKADDYKVSSLRSDVGSLERACRELCSQVTGLRNELEACQERLRQVEFRQEEITQ